MIWVKIILDKWFKLPQLGKEVFSDLMKAKVMYDTKFGFQFTSQTNVTRAMAILSSSLGEDVELASVCFVCGNPLEDATKQALICQDCQEKDSAYDLYVMKFAKLMERI